VSDGLSSLAEQLVSRVLRPLGLLVLSPERIRETLDEAAERGRVTRTDANELALELIQRGRLQTEELLGQVGSATRRARRSESVDRIVAGADRARRTVGVGSSFPISGYDELNATQIRRRLATLSREELRKVRTHELRHAKRKSVLAAIDKALG
jgi:polyhydroxyalkanoate synthesis regulator phasin